MTRDGKFHAMGLVVDTFDEAFDRCIEKTNAPLDSFCTLIAWEDEPVGNFMASFYIAGTKEFLRQCLS